MMRLKSLLKYNLLLLQNITSNIYHSFRARTQLFMEGRKRRLIISQTTLKDSGTIMAKTNKDETSCQLKVLRKYITTL